MLVSRCLNNMKDDISIFTEVRENGDDYIVKATIIKNGNSYETHAEGSCIESTEDEAIKRAIEFMLKVNNK